MAYGTFHSSEIRVEIKKLEMRFLKVKFSPQKRSCKTKRPAAWAKYVSLP